MLSVNEMKTQMKKDKYIRGEVTISVEEMIENDLDSFLDLLAEKLTGSFCLMDISYNLLRIQEGEVVFEVAGDASLLIEEI
jgi:hypothetical protein